MSRHGVLRRGVLRHGVRGLPRVAHSHVARYDSSPRHARCRD